MSKPAAARILRPRSRPAAPQPALTPEPIDLDRVVWDRVVWDPGYRRRVKALLNAAAPSTGRTGIA